MHPALYEALILGLLGTSGIALGVLGGVRKAFPLAAIGLGIGVAIRVFSAFASWSIGRPDLAWELWMSLSAVGLLVGVALSWRLWREALLATSVFAGLSIAALSTKYIFDVGERHHSDSADTVALSLVAIQREASDLSEIAGSFKRGIAYPLMLGLGPDGRILGGFTPLVLLMTLALCGWLVRSLTHGRAPRAAFITSAVAMGLFSLSVPMFRVSLSYLNGHTLMGFGLLLMATGLLIYRHEKALTREAALFMAIGAAIGATARVEGIVLVLIMFAAILSESHLSGSSARSGLFGALGLGGLSVAWWLSSLNSPVLDRFGLSDWALVVATLIGAGIASSSWLDPIRRFILPAATVVLLLLLARIVWQSGDPVGMVLAQWPNLGLGAGGWATAAHMFVGSVILLAFSNRSPIYTRLLWITALIIGAILFTKSFDGGFGREGFYDSVNRMWLHSMPLVLTTTLLGYTELLGSVWRRKSVHPDAEDTSSPREKEAAY